MRKPTNPIRKTLIRMTTASEQRQGRIKHAFHQAGDDVKHTFFKVRRSFVDFFQDK